MDAITVIGLIMSLAGLAGVIWCIRKAATLRKVELAPEDMKSELQKLIFVHMAAIGGAFLGLGLLVVGLLLS